MADLMPTDSNLIFSLDQVEFHYVDERPALKGISLKVCRSERVAILGANGCGKSTLLSIMDGLLIPTAGSVEAYGDLITEEKISHENFARFFRSRVAFVFQNPDVQLFCPTVLEEVSFGPLQLDLPKEEIKHRSHQVLALLDIEHLAERAPFSLSGGEKKKVAIASVLSMNPEVLLLDEPGNGLDPRTQAWLIEFLQELGKAGKTIITATHDLSIVDEIADRIIILDEDHKLVADGPTFEVLRDQELLLRANLIHEHYHHHNDVWHRHLHSHIIGHRHEHH
jgi:cobalt/nickel transport system ATP-binding protein